MPQKPYLILAFVGLTVWTCTNPAPEVQNGAMPNRALTPGATLPVTKDDVCTSGYSEKVRNVPSSVKRQIYLSYGIQSHKPREFEVDHLISLELGGSNSPKNLWPEPYDIVWGAHVKDALEDRLHNEVCKGEIDLAAAQKEISSDWIASYKRRFDTNAPLERHHSDRARRRALQSEE